MASCPWGGSEELWSRTALVLREKGHRVSASVPWWPKLSPRVTALGEKGIELFVQPTREPKLPTRLARKVSRSLGLMRPESKWLIRQKPDLVCVSNGNYSDGMESLDACRRLNLPYVSVVQANAEFVWPLDSDLDHLTEVYQNARRVFFVSHGNRLLLESQLGVALPNSEVIRNPFNVRWDNSVDWPSSSGGWNLACVARLESSAKGQDLLLNVLAHDEWKSRPVTVSLFGAGSMEQGLRRLASRLGLDGKVNFRGHVQDIEQVWATHHALVLPSRYEGLPLALVEAMLCGRPSVVTDVAGNAELLEDGISGFVAKAPTIPLLAEALERAWNARESWQMIGERARAAAQKAIPRNPAAAFAERLEALAAKS